MQDPDEQRAAIREEWEGAAERWERRRAWFQAAAEPVSRRMVDLAAVGPGAHVLEAACGLGDTGLLAAERAGADGEVTLADGAEAMVEAARRHAQARGLPGVRVQRMELEWLDRPTASLDAVLVRFGYMLVLDPEAGMREARRVLRPGGRLSLAVWAARERNPWMGAVRGPLESRGLLEPPAPGAPHMFSLADPVALEELLHAAGFLDVAIEEVEIGFASPDAAAHRDALMDTSGSMNRVMASIEDQRRADVLDEVDAALAAAATAGPDQDVVMPGVVLVAGAEA